MSALLTRRTPLHVALCAVVLLLATTISAGVHARHGGNWAFDGYAYATRMLMDRGVPMERARRAAQERFERVGATAKEGPLLHAPTPPYWRLFALRPVYPWIASRLWPRFGFDALVVVSSAAYVVAILALFGLLLEFAPPGIAALVAFCASQLPDVVLMARSTLTDMTALAFSTVAFWCLIRYLRSSSRSTLIAYGVLAGALTFTHPQTYLLLLGAAGALVVALRRDRRIAIAAMRLTTISALWCAVYLAAAHVTQAPGPLAVFAQQRDGRWPALSFAGWYLGALGYAAAWGIAHAFSMVLPPFGAAVIVQRRSLPVLGALLGSLASVVPALLLDPIAGDVARTVLLPILPAIACGCAIGCTQLLPRPLQVLPFVSARAA